jgi:putative DNA primase/helicase
VDRWPNTDFRKLADDVFSELESLTAEQATAERDQFDADGIPFLRFDAEAQEIFDRWRDRLEHHIRSDAEHPAMESHLAKYRSLIPSLALILHLIDVGTGPVGKDALEKAIAWGAYLATHARRVYAAVIDGPNVAARELGRRIEKGDVKSNFAARDIYRSGWSGLDRERTLAALDLLVTLGWLGEVITDKGGRPGVRYLVNPRILKGHGDGTDKTDKRGGKGASVGSVGTDSEAFPKNDTRERGRI